MGIGLINIKLSSFNLQFPIFLAPLEGDGGGLGSRLASALDLVLVIIRVRVRVRSNRVSEKEGPVLRESRVKAMSPICTRETGCATTPGEQH